MTKSRKKSGPGKSYRNNISLNELHTLFPDDKVAEEFFIKSRWNNTIHCPKCGSIDIKEKQKRKNRMLREWRCRECVKDFTVKTDSILHDSRIPLQKWAQAVYLFAVNLRGISSMELQHWVGVTQKTAWYMGQRIRKALEDNDLVFFGPVEVDESHFGGKERFKHKNKKLNAGRGAVGKTTIIGVKNRATNQIYAKVIDETKAPDLQGFVKERVARGADVYTDENRGYVGLNKHYRHERVKHNAKQYVRYREDGEKIHSNGVENFWSTMKRGQHGTFYKMSPKHLDRYAQEFYGRHNIRELDTEEMVVSIVRGMDAKRLTYKELIKDNGRDNGSGMKKAA